MPSAVNGAALGGVPAPGLPKRPLQWRAEEDRTLNLCGSRGVSFQQHALDLCGRTQPVSTSLGHLCPYLGLKDAIAKLFEVNRDPKGK